MKTYGNIIYSTTDADKPISGICENFTYKDTETLTEVTDLGEIVALIAHARKGTLSFSSTPANGVTALGVRAGNELTLTTSSTSDLDTSSVTGGKVIVTNSSAKWQRGQPMVMDGQAVHLPSLSSTTAGSITPATINLSGGNGSIVTPTDKVWWGVSGLTAGSGGIPAGILQSCTISESIQLMEEEDQTGSIIAAILHGYKAMLSLEVNSSASIDSLVGSTVTAFTNFLCQEAEVKSTKGALRTIMLTGICVPGVTS